MTIAYLNVDTDRQHLDIQREEISSFAAAKDIHVDKWVMEVSDTIKASPFFKRSRTSFNFGPGCFAFSPDTYRLHGEGRDGLLYKRSLYIR